MMARFKRIRIYMFLKSLLNLHFQVFKYELKAGVVVQLKFVFFQVVQSL